MKNEIHVIKKGEYWRAQYPNGKLCEMSSKYRTPIVGWALSLGKPVVVHDEAGRVEEVLAPEERSRFHFLMFVVAFSFLVMIVGAVCLVIWLCRQLQI